MLRIGLVGWRGMVGSVLMSRMRDEGDFTGRDYRFFSTSQAGEPGPDIGGGAQPLLDAGDLDALAGMDVIVTCQGSDYTKQVHPRLRQRGWTGYWIDAASALRMRDDSVIVLAPINQPVIDAALRRGCRDLIGGNCTVSLLLMAIGQLLKDDLVEWVSSMTYQAYSGAGAQAVQAFFQQMHGLTAATGNLTGAAADVGEIDRRVSETIRAEGFAAASGGVPFVANLLPWIDEPVGTEGQTREEWKATAEANKILQAGERIAIDGVCVRVGAVRCHSQALTMKLRQPIPTPEVEALLARTSPWTRVVPNTRDETLRQLTPVAVAGSLEVKIGRLRKLNFGPEYLTAFTVGDQLLWGAAEPLRCALNTVAAHLQPAQAAE